MATSQSKSSDKAFTKRRSVAAGLALADAAHEATWRLYCDVFALWRGCGRKRCRRHRRCDGAPAPCLLRALPSIPFTAQSAAMRDVIAGGPRRLPPASHLEAKVRREPLPALMAWRVGEAA